MKAEDISDDNNRSSKK